MDTAWHRCNIHYYLREKYYGKVKKVSKHVASQLTNNSDFLFYHGIAQILQGQVQQGINELTPLQSDPDLLLAVLIALIYGHKTLATLERDTLHSLEIKLKEERKQGTARSYYFAGLFLSLSGKYEKASEYINKSLKRDSNNVDTIILKGYNDMYLCSGEMQVSVLDCLELALNKSNKHPEGLLGLAKYKYFAKDHTASNLTLDRLIVSDPGQVVPLVEKLKNEFAMQKWDAVYDTLERVFLQEPDNIEALKIRIYLALCKNSDYIEAADQLNRFFTVMENEETYNGYQFYTTAQIYSKTCCKSSSVLSQAYRFAQYASEMYPQNVDYLSEVGYQCILQGKTKDALGFFKAASKLDSNSIIALCGLTLCQMSESGATEQAAQQIELLFEMQGSDKLPLLYLLSAKLNEKSSAKAVTFLNTASETKIANAKKSPFSLLYIKNLDPDFMLDVYKEYKKHLPKKPSVIVGYLIYTQETNHASVNNCLKILDTVCEACPGLIAGLYELAKLKFLFGLSSEAHKLAQHIGELDNTHAGSQILLAQIHIQQQAFTKAAQCLEMCLSYNFKVRDSAIYHFLNGVILKSANQHKEALASFTTALSIVNNKNANVSRVFDSDLNIIDKATLYVQIIEIQSGLSQFSEAGITMQDAIKDLSFTSEEGRLALAKAELALKKDDVDKAIDILNEIKPGQPYYFQAHTKMAHIYLKEKKDKAMFTTCFKDVVSNHPMADAHTMMGDAYMSIHEPEQAAECYAAAAAASPRDVSLVKKLGAALVKMHEYDRAIQHYEQAVEAVGDEELMFEFLGVLIKLKQYDKADATISEELNQPQNKEKDMNTLKRRVKFLDIQAKVRELKNPTAGNTTLILTEAKDIQTAIVKRIEIDARGDLQEEKRLLASLLCSLAKAKSAKEPAVAANLYSEALVQCPRDPDTLLALAKLYAQMNNQEKCSATCAALLSAQPEHEAAAVMMADLAFRKVDLETAHRHLQQILSVRPCSYSALAQHVTVQWRRGARAEAEAALDAARAAAGDKLDAGYYYCLGLLSSYSGKPNAALRQLNQCRRDVVWGAAAARAMVLLCLSQDPPEARAEGYGADDGDTRALALRTAEKLLSEVPVSSRRSLHALLLAASRQKPQAERVLHEFLPLLGEDAHQDDPYLLLAVANAYNVLKQPTRAKNILKRTISSIPWTPENADGLERCWLEVADSQVSAGRAEAARELLTKILNHNRSCAPAYQLLGFLAEKEQNYKSAAQNFDNAWRYTGKTNLAVGYKLAHAYLKLKKYPECIVVSTHILKTHPDYPKIRKEILEKAKTNLRT
ncbi:tetratricopeptide repeat protein 21B [Plutella xylostella]|uniref:tetratricopeptide repeat protein 21B n=1 Tax=Plutella xylostella TaxID=51655 RepID=UPI00203250D5|nr:tetratricopeptide repeat protein 21B [Plutella xylostella]